MAEKLIRKRVHNYCIVLSITAKFNSYRQNFDNGLLQIRLDSIYSPEASRNLFHNKLVHYSVMLDRNVQTTVHPSNQLFVG